MNDSMAEWTLGLVLWVDELENNILCWCCISPKWGDGFQWYIKTVNWLLHLMAVEIFSLLNWSFVFMFFETICVLDAEKTYVKFNKKNPNQTILIYRRRFNYWTKCLSADLMTLQRLSSETLQRCWMGIPCQRAVI